VLHELLLPEFFHMIRSLEGTPDKRGLLGRVQRKDSLLLN
jgi:hypothetical protein